MNNLQWFIDRIGKVIYRDKNDCGCPICLKTEKNGVKIIDKMHAEALYEHQNAYTYDGTDLNYRDIK